MFDTVGTRAAPSARRSVVDWRMKVLVLFGTRPEAIKLAPVIHELQEQFFQTIVVSSSQHRQLLAPFLRRLEIEVDFDLRVMKQNQSPNDVLSRVIAELDPVLASEKPDLVLVQGDTTTALAGAMAAFNHKVPVGHVEAGLRSGNALSPFPEEMNRRLISRIASMHFAATENNRRALLAEGIADDAIVVTGNPVVDGLNKMLRWLDASPEIDDLIAATKGQKRILLTTHRRESFGEAMTRNLTELRRFVEQHEDVSLIFPVHPNPSVRDAAREILGNRDDIYLLDPLDYSDFLAVMRSAWVIVSDSGGVQEEAPSLGKPLLVIRENTERPEAIAAGVARLVGSEPDALHDLLEESYANDAWIRSVTKIANPFGDGRAAERIVQAIEAKLASPVMDAVAEASSVTSL